MTPTMRRAVATVAGVVLMGFGLSACAAAPRAPAQPLPTPTPFKAGTEATAANVAPTPAFCTGPRSVPAAAAVPRRLSSVFADGIGAGPVYAVGPMGSPTVSFVNDGAVAKGWPVKELWVMNPRWHTGRVTLRGHNLVTGAPVVFSFSDGSAPQSTHPKLSGSPAWARKADVWTQAHSYVVFPAAGCYAISASWSTGSWQITEAVGYGQAVAPEAQDPEVDQAEARRAALTAVKRIGHGLTILTGTLETLADADAAEGVQLPPRSDPGGYLVWKFWFSGSRAEASCIVVPGFNSGASTPETTCSLTVRS